LQLSQVELQKRADSFYLFVPAGLRTVGTFENLIRIPCLKSFTPVFPADLVCR
jgi:hypothetical protein